MTVRASIRPLCAAGVLLLLGACAHKPPPERIVAPAVVAPTTAPNDSAQAEPPPSIALPREWRQQQGELERHAARLDLGDDMIKIALPALKAALEIIRIVLEPGELLIDRGLLDLVEGEPEPEIPPGENPPAP